MNTLSRNTPVAFVVGAASFLGSHLVDELLKKGIQVVGLDDLQKIGNENIIEAGKDKNFHLLNQPLAQEIVITLPRLDYAFFITSLDDEDKPILRSIASFLKLCKQYQPKIVLSSSIELYDNKREGLTDLREAEQKLAQYSQDVDNGKINARVVRLATVYGPRMHLAGQDPVARLLKSAALNKLQEENTPLDFTTRAIFVADAVNLLIKTIMHGSTSQKIYDGALINPVKISEIKQVLLDPLWHESKGFTPTELPPWPTPNLLKSEKELGWKALTSVVSALRKTISFFKDNPELVEKHKEKEEAPKPEPQPQVNRLGWEKKENTENTKEDGKSEGSLQKRHQPEVININLAHFGKSFLKKTKSLVIICLSLFLVGFGLIYPVINITMENFSLKNHFKNSNQSLGAGDFEKAKEEASEAKNSAQNIKKELAPIWAVKNLGLYSNKLQALEELVNFNILTAEALESSINGSQNLSKSMRTVSGEQGDLKSLVATSSAEFKLAQSKLALVKSRLDSGNLNYPFLVQDLVIELRENIKVFQQQVSDGETLATVFSELVPVSGKKTYLVLLQDNTTLRAGGGVVEAYAQVNLENGKMMNVKVDSISNLEKGFNTHIEPPAELKKDLGQSNWSFKDVNFEVDFPVNGKMAAWFYQKETGNKVDGVIVLDLVAARNLLEVFGSVGLSDSQEKLTSTNLMEKVVSGNSNFYAILLKEMVNRIFFLQKENVKIAGAIGESLKEKHILVYMNNPQFFSYVTSQNWSGVMPRQKTEEKGERSEFLFPVETNLTSNHNNYFIQRGWNLESKIDEEGRVTHKLIGEYTNQDQNDLSGSYKAKLKTYLPAGTRLTRAMWGEKDIFKEVGSFSDFGRAGYTVSLSLLPREQKRLVLEYQDLKSLDFVDNQVKYSLNIIKQPGTNNDKFTFNISYPAVYKLVSAKGFQLENQKASITSELSCDQLFELVLNK